VWVCVYTYSHITMSVYSTSE